MAKQNFLAGGYYGKLGATVGQRWKNIRTIRTYVIPHNPRTPEQQANRNKFSRAVPYAQLGQQTNYGSILFKDEAKPEWSIRMKSAIANINAGLSDVGIVPTYPVGFNAPYKVTAIDIIDMPTPVTFKARLTGNLPTEAREYSLILYLSDVAEEFRYLVSSGYSTVEQPDVVTFYNPSADKLVLSPLTGKIVSTDDEVLNTVVASGKVQVSRSGSLSWSWRGASIYGELNDDEGACALAIEKDGIGDGSFTGTVRMAFTEGTYTVIYSNGSSDTHDISKLEMVNVEGFNEDNTNQLLFGFEAETTATETKRVEEIILQNCAPFLSLSNYKQNGYDNVITGQTPLDPIEVMHLTM